MMSNLIVLQGIVILFLWMEGYRNDPFPKWEIVESDYNSSAQTQIQQSYLNLEIDVDFGKIR